MAEKKPAEKHCVLTLPDGQTLTYIWTRKAVKNINIRIRPDGLIGVSSPKRAAEREIRTILEQKIDFILDALKRYDAVQEKQNGPSGADGELLSLWGDRYLVTSCIGAQNRAVLLPDGRLRLTMKEDTPELRRQLIRAFLAEESRRRMTPIFHRMRAQFCTIPGFPAETEIPLRFRWMTSRWGSCRTGGDPAITLNTRLLFYPIACAEYVIVHELAHLLHPNHSAAFYAVVAQVMPDWQIHRAKLRENR